MRKLLILFIVLFSSYAFAGPLITGGSSESNETEQEYGSTSITWYATGFYDGCALQPASTTTPMVVSYGYLYATSATGSNGFWIAIFENDGGSLGDQVGGCSDEGTIATDADPLNAVWNQTTWSSDLPSLSADTAYWICYWTDASATVWYEDGAAGTGLYDAGTGTCATEPTTPGVIQTNISVSNYVAH